MRERVVLGTLFALGSLLIVGAAHGPGAEPDAAFEPARLLFMVDYIAVDYGEAVHDGRIADPAEYEEMQEYSGVLLEQFDVLARDGASAAVRDDLRELQRSISERRTWDDFAPRTPQAPLRLSLEDLATRSNDDLLSLARRARPEATLADVDFLRQNGPGQP